MCNFTHPSSSAGLNGAVAHMHLCATGGSRSYWGSQPDQCSFPSLLSSWAPLRSITVSNKQGIVKPLWLRLAVTFLFVNTFLSQNWSHPNTAAPITMLVLLRGARRDRIDAVRARERVRFPSGFLQDGFWDTKYQRKEKQLPFAPCRLLHLHKRFLSSQISIASLYSSPFVQVIYTVKPVRQ